METHLHDEPANRKLRRPIVTFFTKDTIIPLAAVISVNGASNRHLCEMCWNSLVGTFTHYGVYCLKANSRYGRQPDRANHLEVLAVIGSAFVRQPVRHHIEWTVVFWDVRFQRYLERCIICCFAAAATATMTYEQSTYRPTAAAGRFTRHSREAFVTVGRYRLESLALKK